MSGGQRTLLTWVAIILLISYLANVHLGNFIGDIIQAAQHVHNSNAGH